LSICNTVTAKNHDQTLKTQALSTEIIPD